MKENFLAKLSKNEEEKKLVSEIHEDVEKIKVIRLKIGEQINQYLENSNKTKKEIFDILSQDKTIKPTQLKTMIDEAYFNKKYSPSIKLEAFEIKKLKFYFKKNKIGVEEQKEILKDSDKIYNLLENIEIEKEEKKLTRHVLEFDEETEEVFQNALAAANKLTDEKLNMSKGLKLIMMEFISTYPHLSKEEEEDLDF